MASPLSSSPTSQSPSSPPQTNEQSLVIAPRTNQSSAPKKSAPIPWSHQETLGIIKAYQEKWYSLNKGQLKAFQWDEVAAAVATSCGFDEPSKTSTQCRHKIEKLRKRYRSELQKPYPESWQYFSLMDQMERGPMALTARPVAVIKPSSTTAHHGFSYHSNNLHPSRSNSKRGNFGGESDESDEEWSIGGSAKRNRSKSINNLVRNDAVNGVRNAKRVAIERGFSGNQMNGKLNQYYASGEYSYDEDVEEEDVWEEDEGHYGVDERALAAGIKDFAEGFVRSESKKIEMMRETERCRMEMEKKRMEMILVAQKKIIETIASAFRNS